MTRINKSKDGIIGPGPKPVEPEPTPVPKAKKKKGFKPTMKAKKTKKQ